jgi:uncharacterized membrane protein HdeD (DUF308 family)
MESSMPAPERTAIKEVASLWWLWVVAGVAWTIVALVILQFDQASVTTVGVIVGLMFLATGAQQLALMMLVDRMGWLFGIFGVLFLIAGVIALISPENTFAALADVLGFLFLIVGAFWIIQAFQERAINPVWWLGLTAGILMLMLAFWTSGQFYINKAYTLLVFAGIWALMHGITDLVRAFQIRQLKEL